MASRRRAGRAGALVGVAVVLLIWGAAPAWAAPTISVTPSTDLVDDEVVTVSGTGYEPDTQVGLAVCEADPLSLADCDLDNIRVPRTDGGGAFETTFPVRRHIDTDDGITDCAGAPGACVLGNGPPELGPDFAAVPLSFDPDVPGIPPLRMTAVVSDRAAIDRRTGQAAVLVTVTCNQAAVVDVVGVLEQSSPRGITRSASTSELGPCDEQGRKVLLRLQPTSGRFSGGDADFEGNATASSSRGVVFQGFEVVVYVVHSK
jgi:Neocarzinostatin family